MMADLMGFFGMHPGDEINFTIGVQIAVMLALCLGPLAAVMVWMGGLTRRSRDDGRRRRY